MYKIRLGGRGFEVSSHIFNLYQFHLYQPFVQSVAQRITDYAM